MRSLYQNGNILKIIEKNKSYSWGLVCLVVCCDTASVSEKHPTSFADMLGKLVF